MVDIGISGSRTGVGQSSKGLVVAFCAAIFLSASLLFSVQPLFTKMILPLLGGSSNVWNTAMVFFQAMLLGGYIYAWAVSRYLPFKAQIATHLVVTAFGFVFLPLAIAQGWTPPGNAMPTFWLLGLFAVSVGAPFFALSANAPLLQRWFSYTDHPDAQDPYFLYAVSNAGSLLVLCAYPILFEPNLRLLAQTEIWSAGYYLLWGALLLAGMIAVLRRAAPETVIEAAAEPVLVLGWRRPLIWTGLAFLPSSLMLGVTTFTSNNIASAPFLWIIPLALYLLTFVIAFGNSKRLKAARVAFWALPLAGAAMIAMINLGEAVPRIIVQLVAFFCVALYLHMRLVEDRPDTAHLTKFYIFMSLGGVLGGAFNALAAPLLFDNVWEYPLVMTAAFAVILSEPRFRPTRKIEWRDAGVFTAISLTALMGAVWLGANLVTINLVALVGLFMVFRQLGLRVLPGLSGTAVILAAGMLVWSSVNNSVHRDRSFFSTLRVEAEGEGSERVHTFVHGDTIHNIQLRDPALQGVPLAYYSWDNTFDLALRAARRDRENLAVTAIGLGAGALACHVQPAETWRFYEIDPAVVKMARNPELFSFLETCAPDADIRIGDARLTIQEVADGSQDIIIVDAFTSDAIPAHLITREAMQIYQSKLAPGGVIFFHTSNRLLDVSSVVHTTALAEGLTPRFVKTRAFEGPHSEFATPSVGLLVGEESRIRSITDTPEWSELVPSARVEPWTDDYSSIIGPLLSQTFNEVSVKSE